MAEFSLQGAYNWAVNMCNKPNVGYWMSSYWRNMSVKDGVTYVDCSSFMFFALGIGGGYDMSEFGFSTDWELYPEMHGAEHFNAWVVHTMTPRLPKIGFERIYPVPDYWLAGDIVTRYDPKTGEGHTEMCYKSPRITMGAHTSRYPLAQQVSINTWNSKPGDYQYLWRYTGNIGPLPPEPPPQPDPGGDPGSDDRQRMKLWMMCKPWWKI